MSRPRTPATISDTFSDPGSISDLESGWTDLSSNRSGGHLHTSVNGDPSDEENVFEERLDEETWEGILHSDSEVDESTIVAERTLVSGCVSGYPPPSTRSDSPPESTNFASPTSFVTPEGLIESGSCSQDSIRGSRATLRLSFPDPLSNSREDILPLHIGHAKFEQTSRQIDETNLSKDFSASLFASPKEAAYLDDKSTACSTFEDSLSPRFAIILLGYSPLRHIRSSLLDFLLNAVATSLGGSLILSNDLQLSRTFRVSFQRSLILEQHCSDSNADDYIFVCDRTNFLDVRPLEALSCPTLAVVFLQPPNRCPQLPRVPAHVKCLPILLHSLSNDSVSSLLDLTPSMLFDSTHSSITAPDDKIRHYEALCQCEELDILELHVGGGSAGVLTVDQLVATSFQTFSAQLTEAFFSEHQKLGFIKEKYLGLPSKYIIVLFSMLFSAALVLSNVMNPVRTFSFHSNRLPSVQESVHSAHASMAMTLANTLGISAMHYETKSISSFPLVNPTTVCRLRTYSTSVQGYPATLDPSPPVLTLDPPLVKALTLAPAKAIIKKFTVSTESIARKSDSLAIRLTSTLIPLRDVLSQDMQDLLDAIDGFLRAVRDLQDQIVREFGGIVDTIKEQANQGIKDLSNKVSDAVHSLGELASSRHARAKNNARQARIAGEHFINAARQRFESRWTRARSNARKAIDGVLVGKLFLNLGKDDLQDARELEQQGWRGSAM